MQPKSNIKQNQELIQKYETNKITLEQQIYTLKVDEATKEKAINKLKEIKNKPDEMTVKTKQYLEGLVKIPFETFYEEPMTKYMSDNNELFLHVIKNIPEEMINYEIENKTKYTNKEIIMYSKELRQYKVRKTNNINEKSNTKKILKLIQQFLKS